MEYNIYLNKDDLKFLNEQANKNGESFLDYITKIQDNDSNKENKLEDNK